MTWLEAEELLGYWRTSPPTHVMVAWHFGLGAKKKARPLVQSTAADVAALAMHFPRDPQSGG